MRFMAVEVIVGTHSEVRDINFDHIVVIESHPIGHEGRQTCKIFEAGTTECYWHIVGSIEEIRARLRNDGEVIR